MIIVFFTSVFIFIVAYLLASLSAIFEEKENKEKKVKEFERNIEDAFNAVEKYCQNFNSSLDHLKKIKDVFEEFISANSLKDLRPFEGYEIPAHQYFFNEHFYILIDEKLVPKIIIVPYTIGVGDKNTVKGDMEMIKKHLPYTKTLEEFEDFYNKCEKGNKLATEERRRRNRIRNVLEKC